MASAFQTNIWVNGALKFQPSTPPMDTPQQTLAAHRKLVRSLLLHLFWDNDARPQVVMQTRDLGLDRWVDLSSDVLPVIENWNGMVTVDVRVNAGWGDKL